MVWHKAEELGNTDAGQRAEEVAEDQGTWLG